MCSRERSRRSLVCWAARMRGTAWSISSCCRKRSSVSSGIHVSRIAPTALHDMPCSQRDGHQVVHPRSRLKYLHSIHAVLSRGPFPNVEEFVPNKYRHIVRLVMHLVCLIHLGRLKADGDLHASLAVIGRPRAINGNTHMRVLVVAIFEPVGSLPYVFLNRHVRAARRQRRTRGVTDSIGTQHNLICGKLDTHDVILLRDGHHPPGTLPAPLWD